MKYSMECTKNFKRPSKKFWIYNHVLVKIKKNEFKKISNELMFEYSNLGFHLFSMNLRAFYHQILHEQVEG